jgi:hypothetical protein
MFFFLYFGVYLSVRIISPPHTISGRCSESSVGSISSSAAQQANVKSLTGCAQFAALMAVNRPGLAFVSFNSDSSECVWFEACSCLSSDLCLGGAAWSTGAIIDLNNAHSSQGNNTYVHENTTIWEEVLALKRRIVKEEKKDDGIMVAIVVMGTMLGLVVLVLVVGEYAKYRDGLVSYSSYFCCVGSMEC